MTTVLDGPDQVRAALGTHLGYSEPLVLGPERVAQYLSATGDDGTPAGEAPPYLVLATSNLFLPQIVRVDGFSMGVNYGVGTVRFPHAVPVGATIRGGAELTEVTELPNGLQTTMVITIELVGAGTPVCVIESLSRWVP